MCERIDFVIPWVDGSDYEWLLEKNKYQNNGELNSLQISKDEVRFRDWDLLKYWFRGVEKFAPWVGKIHFITWGHVPKWLNLEHEKINIVRHEDYIPKEYLPTFSSHCIELNINKIENLSENFVYFNDDFFILKELKKSDFFENDLVKDEFIMSALTATTDVFSHILYNNMAIINKNFNKMDLNNIPLYKKFHYSYGKDIVRTLSTLPYKNILGFYNHHLPQAFKKTTFDMVWEKEYSVLDECCKNKFRNSNDVNQYLIRYWNLMEGKFIPKKINGKYFTVSDQNIDIIGKIIMEQKVKFIAINDNEDLEDFEKTKKKLIEYFENILPEVSKFEK